jgi:hypothetical protein
LSFANGTRTISPVLAAEGLIMKRTVSVSHLLWGLTAIAGLLVGSLGVTYHVILPSWTATSLMAIGFLVAATSLIVEFMICAGMITVVEHDDEVPHRVRSGSVEVARRGSFAAGTGSGSLPQFANSVTGHGCAAAVAHPHARRAPRHDDTPPDNLTPEQLAAWWARARRRYQRTGDLRRE